jgi:uncharacterized protein YoxC
MEDALKRLDKLTEEEARMAAAQNLEAAHIADESVRRIDNTVIAVDNTMAGADDRVVGIDDRAPRVDDNVTNVNDNLASVGDQMKGISVGVTSVDDSVEVVGDKVAEVIDGAQIILSQLQAREVFNNLNRSDGKETIQVKQMANDVDQAKRPSSPNFISTDYRA